MNGPLVLGYTRPESPAANLRSPDPAEVHLPRNAQIRSYTGNAPVPLNDPIGSVRYLTSAGDILLSPIDSLYLAPAAHTDPCPRQILFRNS
jgi:hypothetical protein